MCMSNWDYIKMHVRHTPPASRASARASIAGDSLTGCTYTKLRTARRRSIAERAAAQGCPATVCGEIGGRPLEALALIGLGFRDFSMSPAAIGPIKAMVLSAHAGEVAQLIETELARASEGTSIRPALAAYAKAHGVPI